jgi:hypothetical protein
MTTGTYESCRQHETYLADQLLELSSSRRAARGRRLLRTVTLFGGANMDDIYHPYSRPRIPPVTAARRPCPTRAPWQEGEKGSQGDMEREA